MCCKNAENQFHLKPNYKMTNSVFKSEITGLHFTKKILEFFF